MELNHGAFHESASFAVALVLGVGIFSQWLAQRLGLPSILILLGAGLLIGGVGFNLLDPATLMPTDTLFDAVSIAVAVILFEGGLSLKFADLDKGGLVLKRLLWIGIPITFMLTALLFHGLFQGAWEFSFLVAAILVVTGPTVIGPLLRQVKPVGRAGPIVQWEGILNDPIGAILAVLMLEVVVERGALHSWGSVGLGLSLALLIGIFGGCLFGFLLVQGLKKTVISTQLQGAVALAMCIVLFVLSNYIQHESGLLSVTIFGIYLANQKVIKTHNIRVFHEHLRTILISALFIILASRFTLDQLYLIDWNVLWFLCGLLFVVRPVSIACATSGTDLPWRERVLLAWMAPRGIVAAAVASLFAMHLSAKNITVATELEPLIYAVIVGTVVVYGLGAKPVASFLSLRPGSKQGVLIIGAQHWSRTIGRALRSEGHTVHFLDFRRELIHDAKLEGLSACDLSVLDARLESEADMPAGIEVMLALSGSNEENALAVLRYEEDYGAGNVYQIVVDRQGIERARELQPSLQYCGNLLFGGSVTFGELDDRFRDGSQAKVTEITDEYSVFNYLDKSKSDSLVVLVIKKSGKIIPIVDQMPKVKSGDKILSLIPADN